MKVVLENLASGGELEEVTNVFPRERRESPQYKKFRKRIEKAEASTNQIRLAIDRQYFMKEAFGPLKHEDFDSLRFLLHHFK